jgi:hypothetical protein
MGRISPCEALLPRILDLTAQNRTRRQMVEELGLSHRALEAFLKRRNIRGTPKTAPHKVDEARMRTLLAEGRTQREIAALLGVSESAIERRVKRLGLQGTARTGPRQGAGHRDWKGGRVVEKHGYIALWMPLHPQADSCGRYAEHRAVVEVMRGSILDASEVVHHKDDHPFHNWPSNLEVFASNADHLRSELTGRVKATRRPSIAGAYRSSRKLARCPGEDETLARCSVRIRRKLAWYIESFRPTSEQRNQPRRAFLRSGARRDPFRESSTE